MIAALKMAGIALAMFVMFHWLTAGQDEIIEGPPETPGVSYIQPAP